MGNPFHPQVPEEFAVQKATADDRHVGPSFPGSRAFQQLTGNSRQLGVG
jgi:hypothetical protein